MQSHGTFSLAANAQPSVAFDYDDDTWHVAFTDNQGHIVTGVLVPGQLGQLTTIANVTSVRSVDISYNSGLIMTYDDSGHVFGLRRNNTDWPTGPGSELLDITGTPLISQSPATGTSAYGRSYVLTDAHYQANPGGVLTSGQIQVFETDAVNLQGLNKIATITGASTPLMSARPAMAVGDSEKVIAQARTYATHDVFVDESGTGYRRGDAYVYSDWPVSIAHGPGKQQYCLKLIFHRLRCKEDINDTHVRLEYLDEFGDVRRVLGEFAIEDAEAAELGGASILLGNECFILSIPMARSHSIQIVLDRDGDEATNTIPLDAFLTDEFVSEVGLTRRIVDLDLPGDDLCTLEVSIHVSPYERPLPEGGCHLVE